MISASISTAGSMQSTPAQLVHAAFVRSITALSRQNTAQNVDSFTTQKILYVLTV
jgi:hypothetical protein